MAPTLLAGVIPVSTAAVAAGCLVAVAAIAVFIYVIFLCVGSKNKDGSGKSKSKKKDDVEIQAVEYNDESSKTTTTTTGEVRLQKEAGGAKTTLLQSYSNDSYCGPEAVPRLTTDHNMNVALPSLEGEAAVNVPAGNLILVDGNRQDGIFFNSIESDNDDAQQILPSGVIKGDRIVSVTILMENMDLDDARNILECACTYPIRLNVRRPDGLYQNVVVHAAADADVASPQAKISGGGVGLPSGGMAVRPEVGLDGRTNLGFSGARVDVPEPAAGFDGDLRVAQSRFGKSLQLNEGIEMADDDEDYENVVPSYRLNADGVGGKLSGFRASAGNDVDAEGDFNTGFGVRGPKFGSDVEAKGIDLKAPTADVEAGGISVGGSKDAKMPSGKLDAGFDEPVVELGDYETDRVKVDHSLGMDSSGIWNSGFDIDELADEDYMNLKAPSYKLNADGAGGKLPDLQASADMEDVDLNLPRGGINTKLPSVQGTSSAGLPKANVHVGGIVTSPKVAEPKLEVSKEPTSPSGYVKAAPLNVSVSSPKEPHELVVSQTSPSYDVKAGSKKPNKLTALFKKDQEKIQMEPVQLHPVVTPDVTADLNSSLVGVSADWPHRNLDVACEADADAMAGIHPIELDGEDEDLHMRAPRLSFSQDEEADVDLSAGAQLPRAGIEQPDNKFGANAEGAGRLGGDFGLSGSPTADINVRGPDAKAKSKTKPLFAGLFGKDKNEKISVQAPTVTADMQSPKIATGARADLGVVDVDSSKPSFQFDAPKASIAGDIGEGDIDGDMDFDGHLKTKTPGLDLPEPANIDIDAERPNFSAGVTQPDVRLSVPTTELPEADFEIAGGNFGGDVNADIEAPGLHLSGKPASPQLPDAKVKAGKGKPLFAGLFSGKKGDKKIAVDAPTAHLTTPEFDASCISLPSGSPNMNVDVSGAHVQSDEDFGADFDAKLRGLSNFGADIEKPDVNLDAAAPDISADISGPAADLSGPNVGLPETGGKRFGGVGADIDADLPTGAARFGLNPEGDLNLTAPELDLSAGDDRDIEADVEAPDLHLEGKAVSPQPPDLKLKGSTGGKGKQLFAGLFGGKEKKPDEHIHLDAPALSAEGKSPKLQGTFDIPSRGVETDMHHGAGLSQKLPGLSDIGGEFDVEPPEFDADVDGTTHSGKMAAPSVQLAASTFDLPEPGVDIGGRGAEFGLKQDVDLSANAPKFDSDLRQDIGADIAAPSLNIEGTHAVPATDVHVKGKGKPLFAGLFGAKEQKKINVEAPTADAKYSKPSVNVGLPSSNVEGDMEHGGGFNVKLPDPKHVGGEFDTELPELGADVEARNAAGRFGAPEVELAPAVDVDTDLDVADIDVPSLSIGGEHAVSPPDAHVKGKGKPPFAGLFDRKEKQINVEAPLLSADAKSPKLSGNVGLPSGGIKTGHGVGGQFEVESPEIDGDAEAPTLDLPDAGANIGGKGLAGFGIPSAGFDTGIEGGTAGFGLKQEAVFTATAPKFDADVDGGMGADIVAPSLNVESKQAVSPPAAHVKGKGKSLFPGLFGSKDKKADKKVSIDAPSLSSEIKAPNTSGSVGFDVPYKSRDLDVSTGHGDFGADFDAVLPNFDGEPLEFGFPEPPELDADGAMDLPGSAGFGGMNAGNISADMPRKSGAVELGSPDVDFEMPGKFGTGADIGEDVEVTKSTFEIGKLDSDVSLSPPNVDSNIGTSGDLGASMEAPNLRLKSPKVKQTAPQPQNVNVKANAEGKGKPLFSGLFGGKGRKDKHIDVEVPTVSADVKSSLDADAGLPTIDAKKSLGIDSSAGKEFVVKGPQLSGGVSPKSAEFDIPDVDGDGGLDLKLRKPEAKLANDANFALPSNELDVSPGIHLPSLPGADVSLPSTKTGLIADMSAMSADADLNMPHLKASGPQVGGGSGKIGLPGADFNAGKISGNQGVKLGADVDAELETLDLKTGGLSGQLQSIGAKESLQLPEIDAEIDKPTLDADLGAGVRATKPSYKFGSPDVKLSGELDDANLNMNAPSSGVRIDTSKIVPDMNVLGSDAGGKFDAKAGGGSDLSFSPGVSLKGAKTVAVSDVNADASLRPVSPQADIHAAKKRHSFFSGLFSGKKDKKKDKHLSYQAPEASAEINPPDTSKNVRTSLPETTLSGTTKPTGGVESQLPKAKLDIDATNKSSFDRPQVGMTTPHVSFGGKQLGGEADVKLDQPDLKSAVTLQRPHTDIDLPSGKIDVSGLKGQKYGVDTSLDGSADISGGLPDGSAGTGFKASTLSRTDTPYIDLDAETEHGRFSFPDADLKSGKIDMNASGKAKLGANTKLEAPFSEDIGEPKVEGDIAGRLPTADIDIGHTSLKTGAGIGVGSVGLGLPDSDANIESPSLAIGGTVPSTDTRISADMQTGKLEFSKTVKHPEVEVGGGLPKASVDLTGPTVDSKVKQPKLKTEAEIAAPEVDVRAGEKKKGFFTNLFSNKGKNKGKINAKVPDLNADAAEVSHELNVGTNFGMKTDVKPKLNVDAGHLNTDLPDANANMVTTNSEMDLSLPDISGIGKLDATKTGFGTEINPPNIGHSTKFEKPLASASATGVLPSVSADADMPSFDIKGKPRIDTKFDKQSIDIGSDVGGGIKLGGAGVLPGHSAKGVVPSMGADVDVPSFGMMGKPGIDAKFDKPSVDVGSDVGGGIKLGGAGGLPGLSAKGGVPSVGADVDVPSFGMKGKPGIDAKFDKPSLDVGSDVGGGIKLGGAGGLPGLSAKGGVPSVGADVDVPSFGMKGQPGIDAKFDKPSLDVGSDVGDGLKLGGAGGLPGLSAKGGVPSMGADVDVPSFGMMGKPGIDAKFDKPSVDVGSDVGGGIKLGGAGGLPGLSAKGGVPSVGADVDVPSFGMNGKPGIDAKFDKPSLDVGSDVGGGIKLGGAGGLPGLSAKGGVPSMGADVDVPSFGMKGKPGIDAKFDKPSVDVGSDVDGGIKLGGAGGLPGLSSKGGVPSVGADVDVSSFGMKGKPPIDARLEKPSVDVGSDVDGEVAFGKSDLSSSRGKLDAEVSLPSASVAMKEPKKKGFLSGLFKSKSKKSGQIEAEISPVKVPDVHASSDVRSPQVSLGETRPLSGEFGLKSSAPDPGAAGAIKVDAPSISKRASVGLDRPNIIAETPQITTPDLQIGVGRGDGGSVGLSEGGKLNAGLTPMDVGIKKNVDLSHDFGMSLEPPTIEQHTDLQNIDAGVKVGGTGDFPGMPTKGSVNIPSFGFKGKDEMGATLDKPSVDASVRGRSLGLGPKFSGDAGKAELSGDRVNKTVELPTIGQQAGIEFGNLEMSPDFEDTELTSDIPHGQVQAAASLPSASISTKDTKKSGGLDGKPSYKFDSPSPKLTGELGDASLSAASSPPTVDVNGGKSVEVDTHKKGGFSFGSWFGGKKHEKSADLNAGLPGAAADKNAQIHATLPGAEMQPVSLDKQGSVGWHVTLPQPDLNASLEPSFSHETSTKVSMPTVRAEVDSPSGKLAAPSVDVSGGKPADVGAHKKGGLSIGGLFGNKKHNKSADLSVGLPEASTDNKSKLDASLPSVSLDKQGSLGGHLTAPKSNLDSSRELSFSHDNSAKVPMPAVAAEIDSPSGRLVAPALDIHGDKSSDLDVHQTGGRSFGANLGKSNGEKSADLNVSLPRANFSNKGQLDEALPEVELPSASVGKHGTVGGKAEFLKPELDTEFKGDIARPSVKVASPSADVNVDESTDVEVHKKGGFSLGGMFGGKKHEKSADLKVSLPETNIDKRSSVGGHMDLPKPELDASVGAGLSRDTSSKISVPTVEADVNSPAGKIAAPSIDVHGGKSADITVSKNEGFFGGIFGGKKRDVSAGFNANLPESSVDGDGKLHATLPKAELPSASVSSVESAEGRAQIRKPTLDATLAPGAVPDGYGKVSLPNLKTDFDAPSIRARGDQTVYGGMHRKDGLSPDGLSIGMERTADLDVALPGSQAPSLSTGKHGSAGGHIEIEKPTFGASFGSTDVRSTKIDATTPTASVNAPSADIGLSSKTGATRFGDFGKSNDVPDVNLRTQSRSMRTMDATVDMGDESSFGFIRPSDLDVENKRAGDITIATSGTRFSSKSVLGSQPEVESHDSDLSFGVTGINYERQARNAEASSYRDTVALDTKPPEVEYKVEDGVFIGNQSTKIAVGSRRESGSAEVGRETEKRRVSSGVLGRRQSSGRSGLDIRPGDIEKAVVSLGARETKADIEADEYDAQNLSTNNGVKSTAIHTLYTSKGSDFEVDRVEETIVSPVERTIQVKTVKTTTYTVTRDADEEEDEETYDLDQRPLKTTVTYRAVEGEQLGSDEGQTEEDADEDDEASLESGQFYFNAGDSMDLNAEAMIKQIGFHPITFPDSSPPPTHNGDDEDEDTQEEDDVEASNEDPESRLSASGPRSTARAARSSDADSKVIVRQSAHSSYTITSFSSAPTSGASTSGGYVGDLSRFALTPVDLPSDDESNEADMTLTPTVDDTDEPVDTVTSPQMVTSQLTVRLSNGSGAAPTRTEEKRSREIVFLRSGTSSTTTTTSRSRVVTTTTEKRKDDVNNNLRDAEFSSNA